MSKHNRRKRTGARKDGNQRASIFDLVFECAKFERSKMSGLINGQFVDYKPKVDENTKRQA